VFHTSGQVFLSIGLFSRRMDYDFVNRLPWTPQAIDKMAASQEGA
jgi:hypothetical protein